MRTGGSSAARRRIGAAVWLYEGSDKMRRTIIVREWDNPNSEVYVQGNVRLGAQCSHVTNQLLEEAGWAAKVPTRCYVAARHRPAPNHARAGALSARAAAAARPASAKHVARSPRSTHVDASSRVDAASATLPLQHCLVKGHGSRPSRLSAEQLTDEIGGPTALRLVHFVGFADDFGEFCMVRSSCGRVTKEIRGAISVMTARCHGGVGDRALARRPRVLGQL